MTDSTGRIDFVLIAELTGTMFNPAKPEGLTFKVPDEVDLELRPKDPELDPFGHRQGLVCRVRTTVAAHPRASQFVDALCSGRFQPYPGMEIQLPFVGWGEVQIEEDGTIRPGFPFPYQLYPPELQTLSSEVRRQLGGVTERFLTLLRWRQAIAAPHVPYASKPALYWKVSGDEYRYVKDASSDVELRTGRNGITWERDDESSLACLWSDKEAVEPLGHELLREAFAVADSSPNSALLIAATALEVGVKRHISRVAPDTTWLLSEIQSPPIHQLIRKYVPWLHRARGRSDIDRWENLTPLFRAAKELAESRNALAHKGEPRADRLSIYQQLEIVSDLVYLLDVLDGQVWAKDHVRTPTLNLLGWHASPTRRSRTTLSVLPRWPPPELRGAPRKPTKTARDKRHKR